MGILIANILFGLLAFYTLIGVVFAFFFVIKGVGKVDPSATRGTWGFRILIFPASAALWPLLLKRWKTGAHLPVEHNPHRDAAKKGEA